MRQNQLSAAILALALFGSGAVVGALGHRYYASTVVNAKTAEDFRHRYISEMQSRVHLTAAQVTELQRIMDDTKAKYRAVRDAYRPEMLQIKAEHIKRVKSILTPEQIPAFERLMAEHERQANEQEDRERRHSHRSAAP